MTIISDKIFNVVIFLLADQRKNDQEAFAVNKM